VAVPAGELERLDDQVDVSRAVVREVPDVVMLQQVHDLEHHEALGPGRAAVDLEVPVTCLQRLLDLPFVPGQVLIADEAAVLPGEPVERAGDPALVEDVARGLHRPAPSEPAVRLFRVADFFERRGELRLHEKVAGLRGLAAGKEEARRSGPLREVVFRLRDPLDHEPADRMPLSRQRDRRLHDFGQRHRPEAVQGKDRAVQRSGDRGV
jgi:hypothetical protein